MKRKTVYFTVIIMLIALIPAAAENIRGKIAGNIILTDSTAAGDNNLTMSIEDLLAVTVDKDSEFIRGFEVEVRVPSQLRNYGSSFAFNIYEAISPEINDGIGTYYGRKYDSLILPNSARFFIRIPVGEKLPQSADPYTTVFSGVTEAADYPLMFTVLPMMKGFPSSLYDSGFSITVNPIYKDAGKLKLEFIIPEGLPRDSLRLSIDGKTVRASDEIRLVSGNHSINAGVAGCADISRTFSIRAGETTNIVFEFEELESSVLIDVPENTVTYIDGEKLEITPEGRIILDPGEHLVLFKIGDYKISKKFELLPGKDCKISLFLDIFIEEN